MSDPDPLRRLDPLQVPADPENGNVSIPLAKALAWLLLASLLLGVIAWLAWIAGWSWIP